MKKTLIALRGVSDAGKSTCLRQALLLLQQTFPQAVYERLSRGARDFAGILTVDGKKIGFESQGDPGSLKTRLIPRLEHFVRENCKVILCATRTYGKTADAPAIYAPGYTIQWVDKERQPPATQGTATTDIAKKLVELTQKALAA